MENKNRTEFSFGRRNYQIMLLGLLVMAIGFIIMALDSAPYGYGILGLTVGPLVLMAGFIIQFFATLAKPKKNVQMDFWQAIVLAIIEGLTEFLPVSSTGHMVIASSLMGISAFEFTKMFTVTIQFGAILSVVVLYWKRFINSIDFYKKLFTAVIPALAIGFVLKDVVDAMLERVEVVAVSLLLGGIILVFVDRWFTDKEKPVTTPSYKNALIIGFFQCIAIIPGVSRSASTIIGGLTQNMTRKAAAEFSFFMAVPTMLAAASYSVLKDLLHLEISDVLTFNLPKIEAGFSSITPQEWQALALGNVVAFLVAMLAIRFFVDFLTKHGFKIFGYYRIVLGLVLLLLMAMGVDLHIV